MFGHKSLPSRIYSYGANAPMENAELVNEQMIAAHRYRNSLVEVELQRRHKVDTALRRLSPSLVTIEKKIEKAEKKLEELRDLIKVDHMQLFHKGANDPAKVALTKELKKELKELWTKRKETRTKLFDTKKWKDEQEKIDDWSYAEDKTKREESGLYWGTYLHVDQSMGNRRAGAPPRFARWDGHGHLAAQIQNGMSFEEALSGEDPRLIIVPGRVEVDGTLTHKTGIKRKLGTALCYFRIGTDELRNPIFAKIPFTMHRPIPDTAQIKWVHLIRYRIATKTEWRLQFVLSQKEWVKEDQAKDGSVGIDLGWRLTEEKNLRVATLVGSDEAVDYLDLPQDWLGEMRRTEFIRSKRDEDFNDAKKSLVAWLGNTRKGWIHKEAETLDQWRSAARLAVLVLKWRENRVKGDEEIFFTLEEWRKRDKHLYEFEGNLRDQLISRRESIYRNFAAALRRKYKTAFIEKLDLRDFHELPNPEDTPKDDGLKKHTRDACLSLLVRCIKESMAETKEVSPKNTTKVHHECGSLEEVNPLEVTHQCSNCGEIYDQDENAARNILGATPKKKAILKR